MDIIAIISLSPFFLCCRRPLITTRSSLSTSTVTPTLRLPGLLRYAYEYLAFLTPSYVSPTHSYLLQDGQVALYSLEDRLTNMDRAVHVRRLVVLDQEKDWKGLPYEGYPWQQVKGANCESVIGFAQIPIGT